MKTNYRNLLRTLPLLALLPVAFQTLARTEIHAEAEAPTSSTTAIAIECAHRYISQSDAARVMRTDSFSQTYAKRQSLYANVARACHRGVRQVLLVVDVPAERQPALASK